MGCFHPTMNRIHSQHSFTSQDILLLTESWNILKTRNIIKFAHEVLIRSITQDSSLRQFWISNIIIDSNNYDYSQGESCLRTDLSWHIGLRDHCIHFILTFDKLLSSIHDEHFLLTQIRSLQLLQNISTLNYRSLMILKQSMMDILQQRFDIYKYNFTDGYEQVWRKFLTFIIKYLLEKDNKTRERPTKIIISPATNIDQTSDNK